MTSPSTLVCTSEEGKWDGLRWYKDGMLVSPEPYLNQESKELLWRWLENIQTKIIDYQGSSIALNRMIGLISQFRNNLQINDQGTPILSLSNNRSVKQEVNVHPMKSGNLIH